MCVSFLIICILQSNWISITMCDLVLIDIMTVFTIHLQSFFHWIYFFSFSFFFVDFFLFSSFFLIENFQFKVNFGRFPLDWRRKNEFVLFCCCLCYFHHNSIREKWRKIDEINGKLRENKCRKEIEGKVKKRKSEHEKGRKDKNEKRGKRWKEKKKLEKEEKKQHKQHQHHLKNVKKKWWTNDNENNLMMSPNDDNWRNGDNWLSLAEELNQCSFEDRTFHQKKNDCWQNWENDEKCKLIENEENLIKKEIIIIFNFSQMKSGKYQMISFNNPKKMKMISQIRELDKKNRFMMIWWNYCLIDEISLNDYKFNWN